MLRAVSTSIPVEAIGSESGDEILVDLNTEPILARDSSFPHSVEDDLERSNNL